MHSCMDLWTFCFGVSCHADVAAHVMDPHTNEDLDRLHHVLNNCYHGSQVMDPHI